MKWTFADNGGGEEAGFHNAGVETFKGRQQSLAREAIQNSLDARVDFKKPVRVSFDLVKLKRRAVPDIDALATTFKQCAKYWPKDKKALQFFKNAEELAKTALIPTLRIGDYNTTGLLGDDGDRERNWFNLIRCSGSSSKLAGEGGSFGIGKNAPFAASRLRVVFYSTHNTEKKRAFQGIARLVTHQQGKKKLQATGYLGGEAGASVRVAAQIPAEFRRKEYGTDVYILGYHGAEDWSKDLIRSVLDNFWPAIHLGELEVTVGDVSISKQNLSQLLDGHAADEDFTGHTYYRAFIADESRKFEKALPTLGEVSLHLYASQGDWPNRVAMIRKTGMIIELKSFRSVVKFCGVFMCRNKDGNAILRDMEPPRHDEWNPDHPEKGAHRAASREYVEFIREAIAQLAPANTDKVLAIPELSQFLPDDEDTSEQGFEGSLDEKAGKSEGFSRKPEERKIDGRPIRQPRKAQPDSGKPDEGENETEQQGAGDGDGGGGGNGTEGGGDGGSGEGEAESMPRRGKTGGTLAKPSVPIRYRAFPIDVTGSDYRLTVTPDKGARGAIMLAVSAVGDDSSSQIAVGSATSDGKLLTINADGMLGPVQLPKRGPLQVELKLVEPRRLSLEVTAHEA